MAAVVVLALVVARPVVVDVIPQVPVHADTVTLLTEYSIGMNRYIGSIYLCTLHGWSGLEPQHHGCWRGGDTAAEHPEHPGHPEHIISSE